MKAACPPFFSSFSRSIRSFALAIHEGFFNGITSSFFFDASSISYDDHSSSFNYLVVDDFRQEDLLLLRIVFLLAEDVHALHRQSKTKNGRSFPSSPYSSAPTRRRTLPASRMEETWIARCAERVNGEVSCSNNDCHRFFPPFRHRCKAQYRSSVRVVSTFHHSLSGCGVYDGSEIHEAVFVLESISRRGAQYQCFAPNIPQMHVVNHLTVFY